MTYDTAGDVINDNLNQYRYDAEGRLCASLTAGPTYTQYLYDAEGRRVAKGAIASTDWPAATATCAAPTAANTFAPNKVYILDLGGQQVSELAVSGTAVSWLNTNAYAGGKLLATYSGTDTYFALNDALGTKRMLYSPDGLKTNFYSLPFGDGLSSSGNAPDASPLHFTGKERDAESGNDYFGARYYSSAMGRFMSPDWSVKVEPVPYSKLDDPQTLNLYDYVRNNPLSNVDADGHACSGVLGNTGSGFCTRADAYAVFDNLVHNQTRFFAAASAATQELADVAVPVLGRAGTSQSTRDFLENTGEALLKVNQQAVLQVYNGQLSGSGAELDSKLVHIEQSTVQQGLNDLQSKDPGAYSTAIGEINGLLNGKSSLTANVGAAIGGVILPTDGAYADVLAGVRTSLGRDINFANQGDREAIGNALVQHVRQTGGCDVAGSRANGCSN